MNNQQKKTHFICSCLFNLPCTFDCVILLISFGTAKGILLIIVILVGWVNKLSLCFFCSGLLHIDFYLVQTRREAFQFRVRDSSTPATGTCYIANQQIYACTIKNNAFTGAKNIWILFLVTYKTRRPVCSCNLFFSMFRELQRTEIFLMEKQRLHR